MGRLLTVTGLTTEFRTERGIVSAVKNVSYHLDEGEILGLVGESGCGKSVSQLSLMQLIPTPPGKIVAGEAVFMGADLLKYEKNSKEMSQIRGKNISMIFQEPMTSLNPSMTIAKQMSEMVLMHEKVTKKEAIERSADMLSQVGIPDAAKRLEDYPYQLSGGMRQRVMVGIAMICNPKMIIADEATTALDATIQAQLLELLYEIVGRYHTALVMVTHNLGIVARYANRINVMYAGHIVETGTVKEIWANPLHPYTEGLIHCVPKLGERLLPIKGMPPSLIGRPPTCPFLSRCQYRQKSCFEENVADLTYVDGGTHATACNVRLKEAGQ
ncbi:MAG: ABC transporter ATP-binding protein [Oscillospiraceae bacterium]|jgi:oligopeptide/dipeptide ABC transporter ATP-binding protein|nr:ABC transporter ATP-binding protein [Oscillospiraceae bacterium]